jgi:hypothetical protein
MNKQNEDSSDGPYGTRNVIIRLKSTAPNDAYVENNQEEVHHAYHQSAFSFYRHWRSALGGE